MINKFLRVGFMFLSFGVLFCNANEQSQPIFDEIFCDYEYAASTTLEEKLYFYESEEQKQKLMGLAYVIQNGAYENKEIPTMGLKIPEGWLVGSSYFYPDGTQHGALAYLNHQNEHVKLLSEPIEDIYVMPFGYLVVTGGVRTFSPQLRHLDVIFGSLYVIKIKNQMATIEKLFELNEEPRTSWKAKSGDVIINFQHSSVLLSKNAFLKNITCSDYQYREFQ